MQDININLTFRTIDEIFKNITFLNNFSLLQILLFIMLICLIIVWALYINPIIAFLIIEFEKNKKIKNKKMALKQILIQKEIEEEIEWQIKNEI